MFGNQCVLLNVPIGHGGDFKGVVSTLKPPATRRGALVDPAEIHTALIESIIEVDEELMMKYFEGEEPTAEQFATLIVRAVAARDADSDRLLLGQDGRRPERTARCAWCSAPCRRPAVARKATKDGDGDRGQSRSERAAGGAGVQDAHRPVRAEAELHPHLSAAR